MFIQIAIACQYSSERIYKVVVRRIIMEMEAEYQHGEGRCNKVYYDLARLPHMQEPVRALPKSDFKTIHFHENVLHSTNYEMKVRSVLPKRLSSLLGDFRATRSPSFVLASLPRPQCTNPASRTRTVLQRQWQRASFAQNARPCMPPRSRPAQQGADPIQHFLSPTLNASSSTTPQPR